ncbi:hypothetical protein PAXRUDRAFT_155670, partial [Paxillus rubicundulus Ve08.2h10]
NVCNTLVSLIEGIDISDWHSMSAFNRAVCVARHPSATVQFFNEIISGFLQTIMKGGKQSVGILGICEAYYGMLKAQGKGTLHGHFMLWLKGNPNPQMLHNQRQEDVNYMVKHGWRLFISVISLKIAEP